MLARSSAHSKIGPFSAADLRAQIEKGTRPLDAGIWYHGLPGWMRAREHPELAAAASSKAKRADDELDRVRWRRRSAP